MEEYESEPFHRMWRPALGWSYVIVCIFDFVIAPTLFTVMQWGSAKIQMWEPLTLSSGGFYHWSMLAVLGIAVGGRTLEKMKNLINK